MVSMDPTRHTRRSWRGACIACRHEYYTDSGSPLQVRRPLRATASTEPSRHPLPRIPCRRGAGAPHTRGGRTGALPSSRPLPVSVRAGACGRAARDRNVGRVPRSGEGSVVTPLQLIARMQAQPNVWHIVGPGWAFMFMPRLGPWVCFWGTHKAWMIPVGYLPRMLEYIALL